jgi:hypothetical protein
MLPAPFVMMLLSCCKLRCVTHYLLIPIRIFLGLIWLFCFARNFLCPPMGYLLSPPTCQFLEVFGSFCFAPFFTWIEDPRNMLFLWIDDPRNMLFMWIEDPWILLITWIDDPRTILFTCLDDLRNILFTWIDDPRNIVDYVDRGSTEYC